LLLDDWADQIDLIVSDGFWQNYRHDLIPYIYKELDTPDNRFQLAVARVHTKIILIETHCGLFITMRGSANLRSSATIEHIEVQESPEIFRFFADFHDEIVRKFKTINHGRQKPVTSKITNKSRGLAGRDNNRLKTWQQKHSKSYRLGRNAQRLQTWRKSEV
jgi:hypothetical protein